MTTDELNQKAAVCFDTSEVLQVRVLTEYPGACALFLTLG